MMLLGTVIFYFLKSLLKNIIKNFCQNKISSNFLGTIQIVYYLHLSKQYLFMFHYQIKK